MRLASRDLTPQVDRLMVFRKVGLRLKNSVEGDLMGTKWTMRGSILGACSCDWGCPCSFDAPPRKGFCEGAYLWHVDKGQFGDVALDGLSFAWFGRSPGPLHEGNVTWLVLADEK